MRRAHSIHWSEVTRANAAGTAPARGWGSKVALMSPEEPRRLRVPRREGGRNVEPEHQPESEMDEDRRERRLVGELRHAGVAENHRLHAAEDGGERDAEGDKG